MCTVTKIANAFGLVTATLIVAGYYSRKYGIYSHAEKKNVPREKKSERQHLRPLFKSLSFLRKTVGKKFRRVISAKNKMSYFCFKSSTGSLVKGTIVSNAKIMDMLALYLDRSVCPGSRGVSLIQRWEHLADEFKVQEDKKRQCENFTGIQSPSEKMFDHLCATRVSLTIKTIKEKLKEIGRNDIICEMEKNSRLGGKTPSMLSCSKIL